MDIRLPVPQARAVQTAMQLLRVQAPAHAAFIAQHARHVAFGGASMCGQGAHACAPLRGDTIFLAVDVSLIPTAHLAGLLFHEALHLVGHAHTCRDRLCTTDRDRDPIYLAQAQLVAFLSVRGRAPLVATRRANPAGALILGTLGAFAAGPVGLAVGLFVGAIAVR